MAQRRLLERPGTILEPTCGVGGLLVAASEVFGPTPQLLGVELDETHLAAARAALDARGHPEHALIHRDFFEVDWTALLADARAPLLVLGNPPWVTNAAQGRLSRRNLPPKTNREGLRGIEALTGRSNFDISEWMTLRLLEVLASRDAAFALLVKTAVARKVLRHAFAHALPLRELAILRIDALAHFSASVDACLFIGRTDARGPPRCAVHPALDEEPTTTVGYADGRLIADLEAYEQTAHVRASPPEQPAWRSGIKHDCAAVLELRRVDGALVNGLGERVDVEPEVLFALHKSSDVATAGPAPERWLLVTQRALNEPTEPLADRAPRAWAYLMRHGARLDARRSSIYRDRPRFCMFGIGPYTFAPWKVAISGLYKTLAFRCIGPRDGKPVVFDDTVYFVACATEDQARRVHALLDSALARRFYGALVFWDAKRPITARILRQLSLRRLAAALGQPPVDLGVAS